MISAARALLRSTEVLGQAIYDDDYENLELAIEERTDRFNELVELVPGKPPAEIKEILVHLRTLDRKVLDAAREMQDEIRRELDALSTARRMTRALAPTAEPARFFEKRV